MPALLLGVLVFVSKRKEKREGLCAPPKRKKRHTTTPPPLQKPHHDHQVKGPNGTLHAFYNKKRRKGGAGGEAILIGRWKSLTQVWVGVRNAADTTGIPDRPSAGHSGPGHAALPHVHRIHGRVCVLHALRCTAADSNGVGRSPRVPRSDHHSF